MSPLLLPNRRRRRRRRQVVLLHRRTRSSLGGDVGGGGGGGGVSGGGIDTIVASTACPSAQRNHQSCFLVVRELIEAVQRHHLFEFESHASARRL
jgi:hypothetical protein